MSLPERKKKRRRRHVTFDLLSRKDREEYEERIGLRYAWLSVDQMEFERKQRLKLIRLSRKTKKQADSWVI